MAITVFEGFDTYSDLAVELQRQSSFAVKGAPTASSETPWNYGKSAGFRMVGLSSQQDEIYIIPPISTWNNQITIGFNYRYNYGINPGVSEQTLFELSTVGETFTGNNGPTKQVLIEARHNDDGSFEVYIPNNNAAWQSEDEIIIFSRPAGWFEYDAWHYWEFSIDIAQGSPPENTGRIQMWLDGEMIFNLLGVTLVRDDAVETRCCFVRLFGSKTSITSAYKFYDDIYLTSDFGQVLGPQRVITLKPNLDYGVPQWEPSISPSWQSPPGSPEGNYHMVNDVIHDEDSSYVSSKTIGAEDMYEVENLPLFAKVISAVRQRIQARKDKTEVRTVAPILQTGPYKIEGDELYMGPDYKNLTGNIYTYDPFTGESWTPEAVNEIKIGHKLK